MKLLIKLLGILKRIGKIFGNLTILEFLGKLWIWIGTGTERKLFSYRWNGSELVPNIHQRIGTDWGPGSKKFGVVNMYAMMCHKATLAPMIPIFDL